MPVTKICPRCGEEYDASVAFCANDGTRLVARGQQTDLIGSVIADRYRIVSSIGEGGMGQVYLAEHVRMKRKSAIKIMRRALVHDVEALQRFTREAENASQIAHPNVAAIFDFGETSDGIVYLAMEYVDGESLAAKLARDFALHPDVSADILGQAADALQAAHDLGILHRDLKPDNIMLGRRPDKTYMVKLVDFGIARTMDGSDQKVTKTGFAIGTPAYMSPEQLAGDVLDARSDQYSLALVAFMALTGKDAFTAESSKESLIARLTSRPRTLQEAKEDVEWPAALQAIFDKALSPEPADRFATVSDFAHALSTAISAMTPTQTAELYRRALDVRIANVTMRTPHSDMLSQRTPSAPLATLTPATPQPTLERPTEPADTADRRAVPREPLIPKAAPASGAYAALSDVPLPSASAAVSGAAPTFFESGARDVSDTGAGDVGHVGEGPQTVTIRRRIPVMAIGVGALALSVAGWMVFGRDNSDTPVAPNADSIAAAARPTESAAAVAVNAAAAGAVLNDSVAAAARDSASKAVADSVKKFKADSVNRRNALVSRFPEAGARALLGGNLDAGNYTVRNDEVRVTIMSPPVTVWRDGRAKTWKEGNMRPDFGVPYDVIDAIEVWSAWKATVRARRAVYVVEAAPSRAPWPTYKPEEIFDIKRGDIASLKVRRDGVEIPLGNVGQVPALVNVDAHEKAKKPNPSEIVATLPPDAFAPRADGSMPKVELVVTERGRNNDVTLNMSEKMVRRLWDDFQPYRDAIAAPATTTTPKPAAK